MSSMPRQLRVYLPGGYFHVTARTQGKAPWFDEAIRDCICECIATAQQQCDTRVVAFAIMPNHLHLVLQQRDHPISRLMHSSMTRIAAAVKRKYKISGHIFEQRYWDRPCMSPEYLRNAIEYVHANPVEAHLCISPSAYRWSSAAMYSGQIRSTPVIVEPIDIDGLTADVGIVPTSVGPGFRPAEDLGSIIDRVLRWYDPPIDVAYLRLARGRRIADVRRVCIETAVNAGYRNYQIARFLKISDSVVSKVVVHLRRKQQLERLCLIEPKSEEDNQSPKK